MICTGAQMTDLEICLAALAKIAAGTTTTLDEETGVYVEVWMSEDELMAMAGHALHQAKMINTIVAPDTAEVSPAVQKSMDYFHRRCAEVDAEAIRAKALDIDAALDAWFDADPDWREWPLADQYRHDMSLAVIAALKGNGEG
jgi:hypothetical protein